MSDKSVAAFYGFEEGMPADLLACFNSNRRPRKARKSITTRFFSREEPTHVNGHSVPFSEMELGMLRQKGLTCDQVIGLCLKNPDVEGLTPRRVMDLLEKGVSFNNVLYTVRMKG